MSEPILQNDREAIMEHACACGEACCLLLLFPTLKNVTVTQVTSLENQVLISVSDAASQATCLTCGVVAVRRHGSYRRRVHHGAIEGRAVVIEVEATRFRCDNPGCPQVTFAAEIPQLVTRLQRRSPAMRTTLELLARAAGGRAGSCLATSLGIDATASRTTLIRLMRDLPAAEAGQAPCWAWTISPAAALS